MKTTTWIKSLFIGLMWGSYSLVYKMAYPTLTNDMAISQLNGTDITFANYQLYQMIWNYAWVVLLLITIFAFHNNIKTFIKGKTKKETL